MFVIKKQLNKFLIFLLIIFSISFLVGFVYLGITNNASIIYTTLLSIPFFLASRLCLLMLDKIIDSKSHYSMKRAIITKTVFIQILSNFLNVCPFFIVVFVVFLTQNATNSIITVNECYIFNLWLVIALTLLIYILNIILVAIGSIQNKKKSINKQA